MTTGPKATPAFDAGHEAAALLEHRNWDNERRRRTDQGHTTVLSALDDLNAWLNDPRQYKKKFHDRPWETMADDVRAAFSTQGPTTIGQTPSLTTLEHELTVAGLGNDPGRRQQCRGLVNAARSELGQAETMVAALDDLVTAAQDQTTSAETMADHADVLRASVQASGRGTSIILGQLQRVLDDKSWEIENARSELADTPDKVIEYSDSQAGLDLAQRLALCQQLLRRSDPIGHQIVWLVYDHAKTRLPSIVVGPVTFFDGPHLINALENGTELHHQVDHGKGRWAGAVTPLPEELPRPGAPASRRWLDWPPHRDTWVAVRVDLGNQQLADPVRTAVQQAESLVRLAAFHHNGTPWKRIPGHKYILDGAARQESFWWAPPDQERYYRDDTDLVIQELQRPIGPHLPIQDPALQDLLDAAAVLDKHYDDLDVTSIVHSIRVIEKISGLAGMGWRQFLIDNYAIEWARESISDAITECINATRGRPQSLDLSALKSMPNDSDLIDYSGANPRFNLATAFSALPGLEQELPDYHPAARLIRTVLSRTSTPAALTNWISDERQAFEQQVNRLNRCRDSLAHGGPFSDETASTVHMLAWAYAKRVTNVALYSLARGKSVAQDQQQRRQRHEHWLNGLSQLSNPADAFR